MIASVVAVYLACTGRRHTRSSLSSAAHSHTCIVQRHTLYNRKRFVTDMVRNMFLHYYTVCQHSFDILLTRPLINEQTMILFILHFHRPQTSNLSLKNWPGGRFWVCFTKSDKQFRPAGYELGNCMFVSYKLVLNVTDCFVQDHRLVSTQFSNVCVNRLYRILFQKTRPHHKQRNFITALKWSSFPDIIRKEQTERPTISKPKCSAAWLVARVDSYEMTKRNRNDRKRHWSANKQQTYS